MSATTEGEPAKETLQKHRQLQQALAMNDAVFMVDTRCNGETIDASATVETEIVIAKEQTGVTPTVLEAIADADLDLVPQPDQGGFTVVTAR